MAELHLAVWFQGLGVVHAGSLSNCHCFLGHLNITELLLMLLLFSQLLNVCCERDRKAYLRPLTQLAETSLLNLRVLSVSMWFSSHSPKDMQVKWTHCVFLCVCWPSDSLVSCPQGCFLLVQWMDGFYCWVIMCRPVNFALCTHIYQTDKSALTKSTTLNFSEH